MKRKLKPRHVLILDLLKKVEAAPRLRTLATLANIGLATAHRTVLELAAMGMLTIRHSKRGNVYSIKEAV